MTGYSHGQAGIAQALLRLYDVTRDGRFRDAALGAIGVENEWFRADESNWQDMRSPDDPNPNCQWCHGATGIGLSGCRSTISFPSKVPTGRRSRQITNSRWPRQSISRAASGSSLLWRHGPARPAARSRAVSRQTGTGRARQTAHGRADGRGAGTRFISIFNRRGPGQSGLLHRRVRHWLPSATHGVSRSPSFDPHVGLTCPRILAASTRPASDQVNCLTASVRKYPSTAISSSNVPCSTMRPRSIT